MASYKSDKCFFLLHKHIPTISLLSNLATNHIHTSLQCQLLLNMQYARLVVFFIAIRLTAASNNLSRYQVEFNGGVPNSHQPEVFGNRHSLRLVRRGTSSGEPPQSSAPPHTLLVSPRTSSSPLQSPQSRTGLPQPAHKGDSTASRESRSGIESSEASRRSASPPTRNPQLSENPARILAQALSPPAQNPSPRKSSSSPSNQRDSSPSRNVEIIASSSPQRSPTSSLSIQQSQSRGASPKSSPKRGPLPARFLSPGSTQPTSRASSPSPYISSESRSSIRAYMGGRGAPVSGPSSPPAGGLLGRFKGLFEKTDKEGPRSGSLQSSSSWSSSLSSLFKGSRAKSAGAGEQRSSTASSPQRALAPVGGRDPGPFRSNPSLQQIESIKRGNLRGESAKLAGPSSSKPRKYTKKPALYQKAMTTGPGQGSLYRSNSDPLTGPLPPSRKAWAKTTRLPNKFATDPRLFTSSSDVPSTPATPQSHSSFELEPARSSRTAASSGRSTIATSAFAQLAQGPPIVGAGLSQTTLHSESTQLPSRSHLRSDSRNGIDSYEILSPPRGRAFNGGTASGPLSLVGKAQEKLGTVSAFAKENPADFSRVVGSTFGHAMLGAAPAIAATGNVPIAAAFGATGATLSYASGNERLIPKIEQWQQKKGMPTVGVQGRTA